MNPRRTYSSLLDLLFARAAETPECAAAFSRSPDGSWAPASWREVAADVRRIADGLARLGLRKGDALAIMARTCREWQLVEYAGMSLGAVVVGVDGHADRDFIGHVLRHSGAAALVVDTRKNLSKIAEDIRAYLRFVVVIDEEVAPDDRGNVLNWRLLLAEQGGNARHGIDVRREDVATLIYTSGTTGTPKGITYTHGQLLVAAESIMGTLPAVGGKDRVLCWLPMSHLFQRMINLVAIMAGGQSYFVDNPREIMACLREVEPSVFVGVPRFYEKVHEGVVDRIGRMPYLVRRIVRWALAVGKSGAGIMRAVADLLVLRRLRRVLGKKMKFMITGSAPCSGEVLGFFHAIGCPLFEAYGISENAVPMAMNMAGASRAGSVGRPLPGNEIKLAPDGEILVRGPGVFDGYHKENRRQGYFTADGFYSTGDLGWIDDDGFLYLTGRKSEIIKTATGRRIAPSKIEAAYERSPFFEHVVVVGNARKYPAALITLNPARFPEGASHDFAKRICDTGVAAEVCRELERFGDVLAPTERVQAFALLPGRFGIETGELTTTLKIKRHRIEERYGNIIEQMYREASLRAVGTREAPCRN